MIFGILSSIGVVVSLFGGWRLYRFTPYVGGEEGYFGVSMAADLSELKREHQKAWGILLVGFALQLAGSLSWVAALL